MAIIEFILSFIWAMFIMVAMITTTGIWITIIGVAVIIGGISVLWNKLFS